MYTITDDTDVITYMFTAMKEASGMTSAQVLDCYPADLLDEITVAGGDII